MFTYLGKFLVLLNAFAAVAVLAWAVSAYATRVDPAEAVDPYGEKLIDKTKRLDSAGATAQKGYEPELVRVAASEARLFDQRARIAARLDQAEKGTFYDIYLAPPAGGTPLPPNPLDPTGLERVDRVVWDSDQKRQINGLDGKPLKGVATMAKELADEQKAATDHIAAIQKSVDQLADLNQQIVALDARHKWLTAVAERHAAETPVLADLRVNWENRAGSLQRRRNQLLTRLEDLKGSKVGAAPPTVTPPVSSFTLTPNK